MRTRKHQYSFAGGEVSPEFFGRGDAVQFQTGLAAARNVVVKPQGSARTRPGGEFVARSFRQGTAAQLMSFTYDIDQAYAIEIGAQVFRFHAAGATLKWATPVDVGELGGVDTLDIVSHVNGILITAGPHGLTSGDEVRVTVEAVGSLPGGLASFTDYKVTVLDSRRLQFSLSASYPTLITIGPGYGSGFMRIFKTSELPRVYVEAENFAPGDVNTTSEVISIANHLFQDGDEFRFGTSGTLPAPLVAGTSYFAVNVVAGVSFQVSETSGGAAINLTTTGTGTHNVSYRYKQGDLAFVPVNGGLFNAGEVVYCQRDNDSDFLYPNTAGDWYLQPYDGALTVPTLYTAVQVFDLNWDQAGDVISLVHPEHPERELRRLSSLKWVVVDITTGATLTAPVPSVTEAYGETIKSLSYQAKGGVSGEPILMNTDESVPGVQTGTALLVTVSGLGSVPQGSTVIVNEVIAGGPPYKFGIRELGGDVITSTATTPTALTIEFAFTDLIADTNDYKVSAVDGAGIESVSAATGAVTNNLANPGASNTVSWAAIAGAVRYRVYKKSSGTGLYGLVGETDSLSFTDSDIAADLTNTTPVPDTDISNAANYSRATARFEQRRCFAGSDLFPRRMFMSRNGTENDFSSRIPVLDDDRISIEVAAREAHVIRHIVPLNDLVLLTQLGEWRVFAINSDAITPTTVAVRPQSYIGASTVRPLVINNSMLFCAARGGHVREMGFQATRQGFVTGDVSLRAAHLFDGYEIKSSAYQKAPVPICWFVSTSGRLLGFTYVPEERIGAWHRHDTEGGSFESVCVIPEGGEDRIYVTTQRTVEGVVVRNVERLAALNPTAPLDSPSLDDSRRYDGAGAGTVTVSGGAFAGQTVTVTTSATTAFSIFDVGKRLYMGANDTAVEITEFVTQNSVKGVLVSDLPTTDRNTALSPWAFGVKTIGGLSELEGASVSIVRSDSSDGLVTVEQNVTVTNGQVELSGWATIADVGRQYTPEQELLPVTMQMDSLGYGRGKALNHAWVRTYESAGLSIGAKGEDTVFKVPDLHVPGGLVTQESRAIVSNKWDPDAQLLVRQTLPLPATIVSVTLEVSVAE